MDFSVENNKDREFFKKDFSCVNELLKRIRKSISDGSVVSLEGLDLDEIISFERNLTFVYITLFQEGLKPIRWCYWRASLVETINRAIE